MGIIILLTNLVQYNKLSLFIVGLSKIASTQADVMAIVFRNFSFHALHYPRMTIILKDVRAEYFWNLCLN